MTALTLTECRGGWLFIDHLSLSVDVRAGTRRSSLSQSLDRALGPPGWPCNGSGSPSMSRPARGGRAYHREKNEHPENPVQTFIGIAADHEKSNAAEADAEDDALQQRARVVSFRWRRWLASTREARVNAGVDFLVDFREERCHHRVAVLRAQLIVRRGRGADFLAGQRGFTHVESVAPWVQPRHRPGNPRAASCQLRSGTRRTMLGQPARAPARPYGLPGDATRSVTYRRRPLMACTTKISPRGWRLIQ